MTKFVVALFFCALALALANGCGCRDELGPASESAPGITSMASPEVQAMAEQLLGSGAEVLASGDLAGNGERQALVVNRLAAKQGAASAVVFSRAAVLEQRGTKWNEILLCDEYLKNPKGFLSGTPMAPTMAWQLQFVSPTPGGKVGEFYFTPLRQGGTRHLPTIVVRWNPKSDRYQSFDLATARFLSEAMSLEPPTSELK